MSRISAESLLRINRPYVAVDATFYLPNIPRNAYQEYLQERLPGAVYFDIDGVKDESQPYPHMMPSKSVFEQKLGLLGVKPTDLLVVYDRQGIFGSPRVKWMLDVFGHPESLLLDNFGDYRKLGGPLESGEPSKRKPVEYLLSGEPSQWVKYEQLRHLVEQDRESYHLIDARPAARFSGSVPEPRPGVASGHIPGSISLPFGDVLKEGSFVDPQEIRPRLEQLGLLDGKPVIISCGSGVTACIVKEVIDPLLDQPAKIYDGSWGEWGVRAQDLIEKD